MPQRTPSRLSTPPSLPRDQAGDDDARGSLGEGPWLSQVHGFHAAARPAAVFLGDSIVGFAAGTLVVAMDVASRRQSFVHGHTDAVSCLAYTGTQALGASGQVRRRGARAAEVLLWSCWDWKVVASFRFHQSDVVAVAFVQRGEVLVTVGSDRDHTLALWATSTEGWYNFKKREQAPLAVASAYKSGGVHGILAAPGAGGDRVAHFVTYGAAHMKFWQTDRYAPVVEGRRGCFGAFGAPKVVVTASFLARDRLVVGGSDGEVYFFEGTTAVRKVQLQQRPVAVLLPMADAVLAVCGGGACCMLLLDAAAAAAQPPSRQRPLELDIGSLPGAPDARLQTPIIGGCASRRGAMLLASRTHLLHVDVAGGLHQSRACTVVLMQPSKRVTAVCALQTEPFILTGALDGGVRCYRSDDHRPLPERSFKAQAAVTCLAVSGCAGGRGAEVWLAVGCEDGMLSIMGQVSFRYVLRRCLSQQHAPLTCARFSGCDASGVQPLWLAVGSQDGCIHTFRFKHPFCDSSAHTGAEAVERVATLRGHDAPVVDVAFADTLPCCYMLSTDAAGQSLAWDVPMGRRLPSTAAVGDAPFSPWTSPVGPLVSGCWAAPPAPGQPLARRFCEVPGRGQIAVSDADAPAVELFPFPCQGRPAAAPPRLLGPAAAVTALQHHGYSDSLLAASDTVLFSWSWQAPRSGGPAIRAPAATVPLAASPARARLFGTPVGAKRAASVSAISPAAYTPPPRRFTPPPGSSTPHRRPGGGILASKENIMDVTAPQWKPGRAPPTLAELAAKEGAGPVPLAEAGPAPPLPAALRPAAPAAQSVASPEPRWLLNSPAEAAQTPTLASRAAAAAAAPWSFGPGSPEGGPEERRSGPPVAKSRSHGLVAGKVGAVEPGIAPQQIVHSTHRIREDTAARARSIHLRQQFDSVGLLLGGQPQEDAATATLVVPQGSYREAAAGRFLCRSRDGGSRCEVEVQLPGGRLLRVLRNPLRRTLTFEGEVVSRWAFCGHAPEVREDGHVAERLVVQLPPTCDLAAAPPRIERLFEEGRCLVEVPHTERSAGVAGAGAAAAGGRSAPAGDGAVAAGQAECEL